MCKRNALGMSRLPERMGLAGLLPALALPFAAAGCNACSTRPRCWRNGSSWKAGPARGISNVMLSQVARVTLKSGALLVIHSPA